MASHDQSSRRDHDVGRRVHHRPGRRPGKGLGEGGERLHYWVFGGPWTYGAEAKGVSSSTMIVAPVVLGAGKRLFEEFSRSLDLEHLGVRQSQLATCLCYRELRAGRAAA